MSTKIFFLFFLGFVLSSCLDLSQQKPTEDGSSAEPSIGVGDGSSPGTAPTPAPIPVHEVIEKAAVSSKGALAPRSYVAKVLSEAFTASGITTATNAGNIKKYVIAQPGPFGPACNPYSSYAAGTNISDCGADSGAGATADFVTESSTVRHLNTSKVCEQILADDNSIYAFAKNISEYPSANNVNEISAAVIAKMFSLFFRGRDISDDELDIYLDMDAQLKAKTPATAKLERWRAILLIMCESPEWVLL